MRRVVGALAIAMICAACEQETAREGASGDAGALWSTAWRLERLGAAGVIEGTEATLEFPEQGRAVGRGSCNRYFAIVAVTDDTIRFSGIGATRMACEEPIAVQETNFLRALESAERYTIEQGELVIHSSALAEPLRFARVE